MSEAIIPIPPERLEPETLQAVIEEFILREGAEHGAEDTPLPVKVEQVRKQLAKGTAVLVYHLEEETVRIVPAHALPR